MFWHCVIRNYLCVFCLNSPWWSVLVFYAILIRASVYIHSGFQCFRLKFWTEIFFAVPAATAESLVMHLVRAIHCAVLRCLRKASSVSEHLFPPSDLVSLCLFCGLWLRHVMVAESWKKLCWCLPCADLLLTDFILFYFVYIFLHKLDLAVSSCYFSRPTSVCWFGSFALVSH